VVAAMTRKTELSAQQLSPVFARAAKARPRVQQPDSPWTVWAGFAGAAVLGVVVFNGMSASREARAETAPPRPVTPPAQAVPVPADRKSVV